MEDAWFRTSAASAGAARCSGSTVTESGSLGGGVTSPGRPPYGDGAAAAAAAAGGATSPGT